MAGHTGGPKGTLWGDLAQNKSIYVAPKITTSPLPQRAVTTLEKKGNPGRNNNLTTTGGQVVSSGGGVLIVLLGKYFEKKRGPSSQARTQDHDAWRLSCALDHYTTQPLTLPTAHKMIWVPYFHTNMYYSSSKELPTRWQKEPSREYVCICIMYYIQKNMAVWGSSAALQGTDVLIT